MQNLEDAPHIIQVLQTSALAQFMRSSKWQYPSIEILHLAGLILVFGSVLVVNLRISMEGYCHFELRMNCASAEV